MMYKIKGPVRRMVFQNPETGKYYHGLGREIEFKIEEEFTDVSNCKTYEEII